MKAVDIDIDGKIYKLFIGQNKRENDSLLRSSAQNDVWFHLENVSGPHMILQMNSEMRMESVPKRYIYHICSLFSQYKNGLGSRYNVMYTELKNVKLTSEKGVVIPVSSKTKKIRVT